MRAAEHRGTTGDDSSSRGKERRQWCSPRVEIWRGAGAKVAAIIGRSCSMASLTEVMDSSGGSDGTSYRRPGDDEELELAALRRPGGAAISSRGSDTTTPGRPMTRSMTRRLHEGNSIFIQKAMLEESTKTEEHATRLVLKFEGWDLPPGRVDFEALSHPGRVSPIPSLKVACFHL